MRCKQCDWVGFRYEVDDGAEFEGETFDGCPECGGECYDVEEGYGHGL